MTIVLMMLMMLMMMMTMIIIIMMMRVMLEVMLEVMMIMMMMIRTAKSNFASSWVELDLSPDFLFIARWRKGGRMILPTEITIYAHVVDISGRRRHASSTKTLQNTIKILTSSKP